MTGEQDGTPLHEKFYHSRPAHEGTSSQFSALVVDAGNPAGASSMFNSLLASQ